MRIDHKTDIAQENFNEMLKIKIKSYSDAGLAGRKLTLSILEDYELNHLRGVLIKNAIMKTTVRFIMDKNKCE